MKFFFKILVWIGILLAFLTIIVGGLVMYNKQKYKITPAKNGLTYQDTARNRVVFELLNKKMRNNAHVAIGIFDKDSVTYIGIKRENDLLKNEDLADKFFQIGSVSKVVTTSILSQLISEGTINAETTIDEYLGFPLKNNIKITIKSLANHTSGLDRMPDGILKNMMLNPDNPYTSYNDQWMEDYLKNKIVIDEKKIGKSEYSNLGMSILGYILAKRKNTSFVNLVDEYIIKKFDMNQFFINNEQNNYKVIQAFDKKNNVAPIWNLNVFAPAGGMVSNAKNMIRFAEVQMDSSFSYLNLAHSPTVDLDKKTSCGLGWMIKKTEENRPILWHNGATGTEGGYTSSIALDKTNKKAVVILSTIHFTDADNSLDKLALKLLD